MGSFSDYAEDKILDHVFGGGNYSRPATLYVALSTADPTDDGSGIAEPAVGSYARVAVTNNGTNFPASSSGAKSNGTAISFPEATASWGACTHFAIFDDPTAGNMIAHGALDVTKNVDEGDTVTFEIGDLDITLD